MQIFDWRYDREAAARLLLRLGDAGGSANKKRQNVSAVLVQKPFTC